MMPLLFFGLRRIDYLEGRSFTTRYDGNFLPTQIDNREVICFSARDFAFVCQGAVQAA
jgi:hypothetical protein